MKRIYRNIRVSGLLFLAALLTSSCFFGTNFEFAAGDPEDGIIRIFLAAFAPQQGIGPCTNLEPAGRFSCVFQWGEEEGDYAISTLDLQGLEFLLFLLLLDPLILQVPAEASDFVGTYRHISSGQTGDLVITEGLSTLRADATQNFEAEAGMQLLLIELPDDAPTEGAYSYSFNFGVPEDFTSVPVKAIFTGRAETAGGNFYLPLFPCTSDMAEVPSFTIPLTGGGISLPVEEGQPCRNEQYSIEQATFEETLHLPMLGKSEE